jgi:hypothetical protein
MSVSEDSSDTSSQQFVPVVLQAILLHAVVSSNMHACRSSWQAQYAWVLELLSQPYHAEVVFRTSLCTQ